MAANPAASGAGFALRNNTIYYNRERGMNLKADNGLAIGNTITGSTVAGIRLGPEYYWGESGFSRAVTVQNNSISDTGYWGGQTAALLISPDSGAPAANGFQNITIDGDTFTNIDCLPLFISSASDVSVANNTFRNVLNNPPYAPLLSWTRRPFRSDRVRDGIHGSSHLREQLLAGLSLHELFGRDIV